MVKIVPRVVNPGVTKDVVIKSRGVISPSLAKKFFGSKGEEVRAERVREGIRTGRTDPHVSTKRLPGRSRSGPSLRQVRPGDFPEDVILPDETPRLFTPEEIAAAGFTPLTMRTAVGLDRFVPVQAPEPTTKRFVTDPETGERVDVSTLSVVRKGPFKDRVVPLQDELIRLRKIKETKQPVVRPTFETLFGLEVESKPTTGPFDFTRRLLGASIAPTLLTPQEKVTFSKSVLRGAIITPIAGAVLAGKALTEAPGAASKLLTDPLGTLTTTATVGTAVGTGIAVSEAQRFLFHPEGLVGELFGVTAAFGALGKTVPKPTAKKVPKSVTGKSVLDSIVPEKGKIIDPFAPLKRKVKTIKEGAFDPFEKFRKTPTKVPTVAETTLTVPETLDITLGKSTIIARKVKDVTKGVAEIDTAILGKSKSKSDVLSTFAVKEVKQGKFEVIVKGEVRTFPPSKLGQRITQEVETKALVRKINQDRIDIERLVTKIKPQKGQTTLTGERLRVAREIRGTGQIRQTESILNLLDVQSSGKVARSAIKTKDLIKFERRTGDVTMAITGFIRNKITPQVAKQRLKDLRALSKSQQSLLGEPTAVQRARIAGELPKSRGSFEQFAKEFGLFPDVFKKPTKLPKSASEAILGKPSKAVLKKKRKVSSLEEDIKLAQAITREQVQVTSGAFKTDFLPTARSVGASELEFLPVPPGFGPPLTGFGLGIGSRSIANQLSIDKQKSFEKQASALRSAIGTGQRNLEKQLSGSGIKVGELNLLGQLQTSISKSAQSQKSAQKQAEKQLEKTAQKQALDLSSKFVFPEITKTNLDIVSFTPGRPTPRPRRVVLPPLLFGGGKTPSKKTGRKQEGYNAFVKREGRIVKLTKNPRTKKTALSLGGAFTDQNPAGSFTIKKARGNATGAEIDTFPFIAKKFRRRKTRKALHLVEKNKFRIDSVGELLGIPGKAKRKRSVV